MKSIFYFFLFPLLFLSCSKQESTDWMERSIAKDFKRYEKRGISKELLESSWAACKKHKEFIRYQIIDSKVYGPDTTIKILLEELTTRYSVPDVDFIYYYEDRLKKSFFKRSKHRHSAPLFVSAKHHSIDQAILFADWNYNVRDTAQGWNGLIEKVNHLYPLSDWSQKTDRLLWRGTPWDGKHFGMYTFANWKTIPRGFLVSESRKDPALIDAAFSEYPFHCAQQDLARCIQEMGEVRYVPWEEALRYKYQILLDGVTCSFPATQWKLLSGCLCFKQHSADIQYFYRELVPWKHYIPIKHDLSDLKEKIRWAQDHDEEAHQIAENGRHFAKTHLMPDQILLYCYKVLCKYASLQTFTPTRPDSRAQSFNL